MQNATTIVNLQCIDLKHKFWVTETLYKLNVLSKNYYTLHRLSYHRPIITTNYVITDGEIVSPTVRGVVGPRVQSNWWRKVLSQTSGRWIRR